MEFESETQSNYVSDHPIWSATMTLIFMYVRYFSIWITVIYEVDLAWPSSGI